MGTRKDCERIVEWINRRDGRPEAGFVRKDGRTVGQVGHLFIDAHSPGDGWTRYRLGVIVSEGGGVSHIGTERAWRLQEFYGFLRGIVAGREELRRMPGGDV